MAGDWIKMRNNLWDDPRVSRLCDLTECPEAMIIGALYWLWSSADEHTEDGHMPGLSLAGIDRKTGVKGFGAALLQVCWITEAEGGINIERFDEHNGASAKRRGMDAQRKANVRNMSAPEADNEQTDDGQNAPKSGAREEKRRIKKINKETPMPEGFSISERVQNWAKEKQIPHIDRHFEYFVGIAKAKGYTYVDWDEAFMRAVRDNWAKLEQKTAAKRGVVV